VSEFVAGMKVQIPNTAALQLGIKNERMAANGWLLVEGA